MSSGENDSAEDKLYQHEKIRRTNTSSRKDNNYDHEDTFIDDSSNVDSSSRRVKKEHLEMDGRGGTRDGEDTGVGAVRTKSRTTSTDYAAVQDTTGRPTKRSQLQASKQMFQTSAQVDKLAVTASASKSTTGSRPVTLKTEDYTTSSTLSVRNPSSSNNQRRPLPPRQIPKVAGVERIDIVTLSDYPHSLISARKQTKKER
ncbi:hypothetical protein LTR17_012681 [Elasticomyces elasticus]|nr:hypothetical protein LTR17_012681 [Elasticomyces elasticus]